MSAKQKTKVRDATQELLTSIKKVGLDPLEVMNRAITRAESEGNYKEMMVGALGLMPYMYPKLKETSLKADIDQNVSGSGVNLNITIGGKKVAGSPEPELDEED